MNKLPIEIYYYIGMFCDRFEIENLSIVSREFRDIYNSNTMWSMLGKRDFPGYSTTDKQDYIINSPMLVKHSDLEYQIKNNKWAFDTISNTENSLVQSYVKSIMFQMLQVSQYRKFFNKHASSMTMDWKISVNIFINQLLTQSEEDKKDLDMYLKMNNLRKFY